MRCKFRKVCYNEKAGNKTRKYQWRSVRILGHINIEVEYKYE